MDCSFVGCIAQKAYARLQQVSRSNTVSIPAIETRSSGIKGAWHVLALSGPSQLSIKA